MFCSTRRPKHRFPGSWSDNVVGEGTSSLQPVQISGNAPSEEPAGLREAPDDSGGAGAGGTLLDLEFNEGKRNPAGKIAGESSGSAA